MPTEQFNRLLRALTVRQRWTTAIVVVLVAAGMYGFMRWQRESSFRPLFTELAPDDASPVVQKLKEDGIAYRLTNNGTTISVPEDRVAELRLEMAGAGLPKTGRLGFELFDKTNFGITEFAEHVNYRRALEGELERSVMSVAEIEQARVHISLPQESVFLEARQPAKASVLIKIRRGAALPETAIPAVTNLVASAVEGLAPENVSVLDMRGNLLNKPKKMGAADESSTAALEYRHKVEQDLVAKLDSTLEPLVGSGHFRAAVSAETEINSGEQSEETYDPTRSVMVSSQKTEDVSTQAHAIEGIPGTASSLPDAAPKPASTGASTSRKTENVDYQTSHTIKRLVLPQGAIHRLSVSVLLDYDLQENSGKQTLVAPTPERLKVIHDLVSAAAGLNTDRGDQLIVESLPFESTMDSLAPDNPAAPVGGSPNAPANESAKKLTLLEQMKKDPKLMIGAAGLLVLVLCGGAFAIFKMKRAKARVVDVQVPGALPQGGAAQAYQTALPSDGGEPAAGGSPVASLGPGKLETLTAQVRATAQKNSEICAGVLRGWLKEERA